MEKLTMEETLEMLIEEGIGSHEKQLAHVRERGRLTARKQVESLERSLEQLYEDFTIEKGLGKSAVVHLGKRRSKIAKRKDKRSFGQGRVYKTGYALDLVQRPEYDAEFCEYMREKYNTYRISQQMVLLEYGYDTYQCRLPSSYRRGKSSNYIYRFLNKDKEVIYVGLTSEINNRMYQHFNVGHLSDEAYDEVETIEYVEVQDETTMNILETYLINKYQPRHNTMLKYKSFNAIDCLDELDTGWKKHRYERREQKDE